MQQKHTVRVEELGLEIGTGSLANLASGAVTISLGETTLFASACAAKTLRPGQDFFPLTVDYREKFAAAGRFPGGYFKREARPTEKEILTSRLCDRPLRPLFPKGFMNEVQVIGMALSIDGIHEPDILMVNAASAALIVSDIPWNGPVGCVRVGEIDGEFVVNPTQEQMFDSTLDLIYVGNEKEMMMIEGSADFISKERFQEALAYGQQQIQPIIAAQKELASKVAKAKSEFELYVPKPEILALCRELTGGKLEEAIFIDDKQSRGAAVDKIKAEVAEAVKAKVGEEEFEEDQISLSFEVLQEEVYRSNILEKGKRADGRAPGDLREISAETGVLPKVHGTAIFNRGETQALVYTTLGTSKDSQDLDALTGGANAKSFYLHYNFPPYSVGETGRFGFTGRREIGHGNLAERSLLPIIPSEDDFPYAIRIVSEIMGSNGSTSMASICGGCLSLMDAGVPVSAMVAGISAGLVTEMNEEGEITKYKVLTDIIGAEDHFGDMDFKIAGSRDGITGFQLDLKIQGIPFDIAHEAIDAATEARLKILDKMAEAMPEPRTEINPNAPRIHSMKIDPDKIGALIGPGGKNIRRIQELTGAEIDINEDNSGRLLVFARGADTLQRAIEEIDLCTAEIEVGRIYKGIVRGVKDFGAFVECLPGKEGLCHISELADFRVKKTEDVCKLGDELVVKCIGIDDKGRVKLSRKAAMADEAEPETAE
ncbi:MAG: polyribonucleotide nucleotidyltransferase, partial [Puniceicoccales bacterium]